MMKDELIVEVSVLMLHEISFFLNLKRSEIAKTSRDTMGRWHKIYFDRRSLAAK